MAFNFTPAQQQAIDDEGHNILVAASAGSGKTRVLVQRVINKIKAGIGIDELLVVTFTEAAAKEMKERIQVALRKEIAETNSEDEKRRYLTQLSKLNVANISTLHAFCLQILKRYYYVINLDPIFRMLTDETEAMLLKENVWDDLREEWYGKNDPIFEELVMNFSTDRSDDGFTDLVMKTFQFASANPNPAKWLASLADEYRLGDESLGESEFYQAKIKPNLIEMLELCHDNLTQGMDAASEAGFEVLYETFKDDLEQLEDLIDFLTGSNEWDEVRESLMNFKFKRAKAVRGLEPSEKKARDEIKKSFRDETAKRIQNFAMQYFIADEKEVLETTKKALHLVEKLGEIVEQFSRRFAKEKRKRHVLDFNDLEHLTLEILNSQTEEGMRVRQGLQDRFKEIMVDEYQDTNQLQETILTTIAQKNPGNMFMVGDVKQSIYGFRLAEPRLFLEKYERFAKDDNDDQRIILAENFRSMENVTLFTNMIFAQLMDKKVGEMTYDKDARLVFGAKYYPHMEPKAELLIYESEQESLATDDDTEPINDDFSIDSKAQGQVVLTAKKIKTMIEQKMPIYDREAQEVRPMKYSDIAILAPTRNHNLILTDTFKKMGVPLYVQDSQNYFQTTELKIMMSLLQIIDNPYQDIPLVAVLRSPIVGLKENELAYLRINDKQADYYQAVVNFYQAYTLKSDTTDFEQKLYHKISRFLEQLEMFREMAHQNELASLIWKIYNETGFLDYVGAMPGGAQRQANLHALYDRAAEYENSSFKVLFQFVRFINKMQAKDKDLGEAPTQVLDNAVTVMTIHGSKGLEFPVVFLLDATHQFNQDALRKPYILSAQNGIGISYTDTQSRIKSDTLMRVLSLENESKKQAAEQMRLLYVALTRAEQQLYLVGAYKDKDEAITKWRKAASSTELVLNSGVRAVTKNFMDWIGMCLIRSSKVSADLGVDFSNNEPKYIKELPFECRVSFYNNQQLGNFQEEVGDNAQEWLLQQNKLGDDSQNTVSSQAKAMIDTVLEDGNYENFILTKTTAYQAVSDLKRVFDDPDVLSMQSLELTMDEKNPQGINRYVQKEFRMPNFMAKETLVTPAEIGVATHLLLQKIPLDKKLSLEELNELLMTMVENQLITPEVAEKVDLNKILEFYESDLGKLLLESNAKVHREEPFSMIMPVGSLFKDIKNDTQDPVLVHGIIDGYLKQEDGIILFDYKTDNFTSEEKLLENYRGQLNLYAMALEDILNKKVIKKIIYSLDLGRSIEV